MGEEKSHFNLFNLMRNWLTALRDDSLLEVIVDFFFRKLPPSVSRFHAVILGFFPTGIMECCVCISRYAIFRIRDNGLETKKPLRKAFGALALG